MTRQREDEPSWRRGLLDHVLPILLFSSLTAALLWTPLQSLGAHTITGSDNSLQSIWNIWWVHHALGELRLPFACDVLFAPNATPLYHHPLNLPVTLLGALLVALGLEPASALLILVFLGFVFTGWVHYLLVRRFEVVRWVALVAGAALSFGPFHVNHSYAGNLGVVGLGFLSLTLLAALHMLRSASFKAGMAAGATMALLLLTDWSLALVGLGLAVLFTMTIAIGSTRSLFKSGYLAALGAAIFSFLLVAGPFIVQVLLTGLSTELTLPASAWAGNADAEGLFLPAPHMLLGQVISSSAGWTGPSSEWGIYLGIVPFGLMIWAIAERRPFSLVLLFSVIVFALLALGPFLRWGGELHQGWMLPQGLLDRYVPFLGVIWHPSRLVAGAACALTIAAALGLESLRDDLGNRRFLAIPLSLLLLAELAPLPAPSSPLDIPRAVRELAQSERPGTIIDVHPPARRLLHQTFHQRPLINGWASRTPLPLIQDLEGDVVLSHIIDPPGVSHTTAERIDQRVRFEWSEDAPPAAIGRQHFRVHWQGRVLAPFSGNYRLLLRHSGTARLLVDGHLLIDSELREGISEGLAFMNLSEGMHSIDVEFHQRSGPGEIELLWARGMGDLVTVPHDALTTNDGENGIMGHYRACSVNASRESLASAGERLAELNIRTIIGPLEMNTDFLRQIDLEPRNIETVMVTDVLESDTADE